MGQYHEPAVDGHCTWYGYGAWAGYRAGHGSGDRDEGRVRGNLVELLLEQGLDRGQLIIQRVYIDAMKGICSSRSMTGTGEVSPYNRCSAALD